MSNRDVWNEPDVKEWLESAARDMFPKMKDSALSITLYSGIVDPKLAIEVGAAILLDKPLIILVPEKQAIPRKLERFADEIVRGDASDPATRSKLIQAINRHMPREA